MAKLPIFKDDNTNLMLLQTQWSSILNTGINNPILNGNFITGVDLTTSSTTINHGLGRKYQGWIVIKQYNGFANINDSLGSNPDRNVALVASADTTVDLYVF